jgi:hypothetical protein
MAQGEDPVVEGLKRRKQEQDEAHAAGQQVAEAKRQLIGEYREAFRELVAIPRERLEAAAQAAGMELATQGRGDTTESGWASIDP